MLRCAGSCQVGGCKKKQTTISDDSCSETEAECLCLNPDGSPGSPTGCSIKPGWTECDGQVTGVSMGCTESGCEEGEFCAPKEFGFWLGEIKFFFAWCDCIEEEDDDEESDQQQYEQQTKPRWTRTERGPEVTRTRALEEFVRETAPGPEWLARHEQVTALPRSTSPLSSDHLLRSFAAEPDGALRMHLMERMDFETLLSISLGDPAVVSSADRARALRLMARHDEPVLVELYEEVLASSELEVRVSAAMALFVRGFEGITARGRMQLHRLAQEEPDVATRRLFRVITRNLAY